MLVSHSHKFIFVKSKKTAGSSIQDYLAPYCKDGIVEKHFPGSHRTAASTREKVGEEVWNSYLKICPVRNPWDALVSWYFWRKRDRSVWVKIKRIIQGKHPENNAFRLPFQQYMHMLNKNDGVNINKHIMYIGDEWPDYFHIRYEHLHEDMQTLCDKLNIPFEKDKFPKEKTGVRKEKGYKKFYDDETREMVAKAFSREIERFGYQF